MRIILSQLVHESCVDVHAERLKKKEKAMVTSS
jgi:hypothetical protein